MEPTVAHKTSEAGARGLIGRLCRNAIMLVLVGAGWACIGASSALAASMWDWGDNGYGELGIGTYAGGSYSTYPVQVLGNGGTGTLSGVTGVAGGGAFKLAVRSDGTVWGWGSAQSGNLADPYLNVATTPVQLKGLSSITAVSAGAGYGLALDTSGSVWSWGGNGQGQLGDGTSTTTPVATPAKISGLSSIVAISAGSAQAVALKSDGTVWTWGDNERGQLGTGSATGPDTCPGGIPCSTTPVQVPGLSSVVAVVAASGYFDLAVKSDGTVWGWGDDSAGQLGDGVTVTGYNIIRPSPVEVQGPGGIGSLGSIVAVAGGVDHSLALSSGGTVYAWGQDTGGQLGDGGASSYRSTPEVVSGVSSVTAIAAGGDDSFALESSGAVWGWGFNAYGEIGDGSAFGGSCNACAQPTPAQVVGPGGTGKLSSVVAIGADEGGNGFALRPEPTVVSTTASAAEPSGAIHDTAHLTGGSGPTGSITFQLYAASDTSCSTPLQTVTIAGVNGDGDYVSPSVSPGPGSYQWVASYSGDPNNLTASSSCNDPNEQVTVPAPTTLTTSASAPDKNGAIQDTAHLSGGSSPSGTIMFQLYAVSDTSCSKPLHTVTTSSVNGNGDYVSPSVSPGPGSYQWVASYSGDSGNLTSASSCNDLNEQVTVPPPTAISTAASSADKNGMVFDTAHLSGGSAPGIVSGSNLLGNPGFELPLGGTQQGGSPVGSSFGNWLAYSQANSSLPTEVGSPVRSGLQSGEVATGSGCSVGAYFVQDHAGVDPNKSYVFSTWIYPVAGTQGAELLFGWDRSSGSTLGSSSMGVSPTGTFFSAWGQNGTGPAITYGVWHELTLVADRSTLTAQFYVDGHLIGTTARGSVVPQSQATVLLGQANTCNSPATHFDFDDVFLGQGTLSAAPTGSITYRLYAASDTSCSNPLQTVTTSGVNGDGDYASPSVSPGPGSYQWVATYSGDANNPAASSSCNDPNEQVSVSPPISLTTSASVADQAGAIYDTARMSGGSSPTGSIVFKLYAAGDASCSNPLKAVTSSVNGDGLYQSPSVSPGSGSYQWVATYSGDQTNNSAAGPCNDPGEQVTVPYPTAVATTASAADRTGTIHDTASLSGGSSPTGSITFKLYAASDSTCTNLLAKVTNGSVTGDGNYVSPSIAPGPGSYQWVASYSGNPRNAASTSSCNDPHEQVVVPRITTTTPCAAWDVSGAWIWIQNGGGSGPADGPATLSQSGSTLTGTVTNTLGSTTQVWTITGTISGSTVNLSLTPPPNSFLVGFDNYVGTISSNGTEIVGSNYGNFTQGHAACTASVTTAAVQSGQAVTATLSLASPATVSAQLSVSPTIAAAAKRIIIGTLTRHLRAGRARLVVHLNRRGRQLLAKNHKLTVTLTIKIIAVRGRARETSVTRRTVRLEYRRR